MKSPSPPPAPDPVATAKAQGDMSKDTATWNALLNSVNQYGPQGSITYTTDPAWEQYLSGQGEQPGTPPRISMTTALSPDQQKLYDQENMISGKSYDLAGDFLDRLGTMGSGPDYSGLPGLEGRVSSGGARRVFDTGPNPMFGLGRDPGDIQKSLDVNGLPTLPGVDDFGAERQRVEDALYGRATSRLDPEWAQTERRMATELANKGITEGSEAYNSELDRLARAKTDAYDAARFGAIQAGGAEQSRLFGLGSQARGQLFGERTTQGTFANQAQAQDFGQALAEADLFNQAQQQLYGQNLAAAQFANQGNQQDFAQDLNAAQLANAARQQGVAERTYDFNLPVNQVSALMGAAPGVSGPSFNPVQFGGAATPDYQGLVTNNYNAAMNAYNNKLASQNALIGNIIGAGGSIGTAMAFKSSKDFKEDKRPVSKDAILDALTELPVESWKYKDGIADGGHHIGPYAEDAGPMFGLGGKAKGIPVIDMMGAQLAGIQALNGKVERLEKRMRG